MDKNELAKLPIEELRKKEKNTKTLVYIFIPLILALAYFSYGDYFRGGEVDSSLSIITICSIGGLVSLLPELKKIRAELERRVV